MRTRSAMTFRTKMRNVIFHIRTYYYTTTIQSVAYIVIICKWTMAAWIHNAAVFFLVAIINRHCKHSSSSREVDERASRIARCIVVLTSTYVELYWLNYSSITYILAEYVPTTNTLAFLPGVSIVIFLTNFWWQKKKLFLLLMTSL